MATEGEVLEGSKEGFTDPGNKQTPTKPAETTAWEIVKGEEAVCLELEEEGRDRAKGTTMHAGCPSGIPLLASGY